MLSIRHSRIRLCDGLTRRESMQIGGLGFTGLLLPHWLKARATAKSPLRSDGFGRAKSCILIFNYGGPSHLDILGPEAGRAPAKSAANSNRPPTACRASRITEHLPRSAALANRYAIVRSVTHRDNDHAIGAYLALTGHSHPKNAILGIEPPATPQDMPSLGSVVSKLRPAGQAGVSLRHARRPAPLRQQRQPGPERRLPRQGSTIRSPFPFVRPIERRRSTFAVVTSRDGRRGRRRSWAAAGSCSTRSNRAAPRWKPPPSMRDLDDFTRRAFELLASPASRDAFDLRKEPATVRDSYGPTALRPQLPAGAAARRGGRAAGHRLLVRQSRLGHARRQLQGV